MEKTITVKGTGKATAKPDLVVLSMNLESRDREYKKAMDMASDNIGHLNKTLEKAGFEKDSVITTDFNVHTEYENIRDKDGSYKNIFKGYVVMHSLKTEFDFDSELLTRALSAIGTCLAHPQLSIAFTIKDPTEINEELLRSASENAKRRAEVLSEASGVKLGELVAIDYNMGKPNVYSNTRYNVADEALGAPMLMAKSISIQPDDIKLTDTVTFVWKIE
jgi:uncharacterized protein YggE